MTETLWKAPETLVERYGPTDLEVFNEQERARFLSPFGEIGEAALRGDESAWDNIAPHIASEILYRKEPELYEQLIAGECIHPGVIEWLPRDVGTIVEVAAGTGRLTMDLVDRCERLIAIEPVEAFRSLLAKKCKVIGATNVEIKSGFFDEIPVASGEADLVVSCSAFTSDPWHGGEQGLRELERVAVPGGLVALVWPANVPWLKEHGFEYESFSGDMFVEFPSVQVALDIARIFYPWAVSEIESRGTNRVHYDTLRVSNPPRDLAWKRTL